MRRLRIMLGLIALWLTTVMCGFYNLDTEYFTKTKPQEADLIGEYVPTESTLQLLHDEGSYETTDLSISIELRDDGSFQIINMPDWASSPEGKSSGAFESSHGLWKMVPQQEWWSVQLDSGGTGFSFQLAGERLPYQLWLYIGDPDSGIALIFERLAEVIPNK